MAGIRSTFSSRWQIGRITKTIVGGRQFGGLRISTITPETLKTFKRGRPLVAGNRDLALLRAAFIGRWFNDGSDITTSPRHPAYLGASLGGDEQDMQQYEQRIGRVPSLTYVDVSAGSTSYEPSGSDTPVTD